MKKTFLMVIVLLQITVMAQSKLDSILFRKVNEYRLSKHVKALQWDTILFKAAENHAKYLYKKNDKYLRGSYTDESFRTTWLHHSQDTLKTPAHRYNLYKHVDLSTFYLAEVCAIGRTQIKDKDPLLYEKMANDILKLYKDSHGHNKIILDKTLKYVGINCQYFNVDAGFMFLKYYIPFSVMDFF